jgi:CubicO group peptidase (beta-lactamase class C family)
MKNDKLERTSPESVGISSSAIEAFLDGAANRGIDLHSIMILRDGKVCAEGWWAPYSPELLHPMYSATKSFTSTAIGFAVQEGLLSLDSKLVDIFSDCLPENPSENLKEATIHDLLCMGCGHETEPSLMGAGEDWIKGFLEHEFKYKPGTTFQYNTAGTNMLCAALYRVSGKQLSEYLRPRFFDKVGIGEFKTIHMPDGTEMGGAGYRVRTEDLAKLCQFILNRGTWNGERLLNEEWFDRIGTKQIETKNDVYKSTSPEWLLGYSYQYWMCKEPGTFRADGLFGQFGVIIPSKNAAVVITETTGDTQGTLDLIWEHLYPAMSEQLPEDSHAEAALKARLNRLTLARFPAGTLKGDTKYNKTYKSTGPGSLGLRGLSGFMSFGAPPAELKSIGFSFGGDTAELTIDEGEGEAKLSVHLGMDYTENTYFGEKYFCRGHWRSPIHFEMEVHAPEAGQGMIINFVFDDEGVSVRPERILTIGGFPGMPPITDPTFRME